MANSRSFNSASIGINAFAISRIPRIEFGAGKRKILPELVLQYGKQVLLVRGKQFLDQTPYWQEICESFRANNIQWQVFVCADEPGPALIDDAVASYADNKFDVVVGIGGGSVLDAAKAIAGLLQVKHSVMDFLEGVGPELTYKGPATPFIAVPTTAGTGSETTKNSVLSIIDPVKGFKKSFRDEKLVAEYAVVDPDFLSYCPASLIAANGMDALTQLLESYVSIKANAITDAMAISGLQSVFRSLIDCYEIACDSSNKETRNADALASQSDLAYASMLSGITLAQVGLGSVHGLASPLGAFFPMPHGEVCGTLLSAATQVNLNALNERDQTSVALSKYADIGRLLADQSIDEINWDKSSDNDAQRLLVETLALWTDQLAMPTLSQYGVEQNNIAHIVKHSRGSSMKTNPIVLHDDEIASILIKRL